MSSLQSLDFNGSTSYLDIPYDASLDFGTGDFTVEWWQYETDNNPHPRPFQIGSYSINIPFGVSIEGGTFYLWLQESPNAITYLQQSDYKNVWVHFAICRTSQYIQVFMNGQPLLNTPLLNIYDYQFSSQQINLTIGSESDHVDSYSHFGGQMYAFTWNIDIAKYSAPFTPSILPPIINSNTRIMLIGNGANGSTPTFETPANGSLGSTIINSGTVTTNSNIPFTPVVTQPYITSKYKPADPLQRRKQNTLNTVKQNYIDNGIYNKNNYAGTNDQYNAAQSVTRVRNGGATVPQKTQHSPYFAIRLFNFTG